MKLISCYIENFGGLSRYSLKFDQGVTAIHAPNGFGKTTLAEFLRAMFYGFPRKAKTLDKSKRQKYTPWGGGKFGGNLVFEYEGRRYRLERTFGATPRGDSFALIDLETGKKSDRFSEEIGLELFQLDADSFERSTYLPQIHDHTVLTTAGIQAKLGDLVEDTGDINNFDKAMTALKNKRSGFVPYRGSGGTVAEATSQISRIQLELDRTKVQEAELERYTAEIGGVQTRILRKKAEIAEKRKQWEQASEAAASRRQYEDLLTRHNVAREQLRTLQGQYPNGIPGEQELDTAREIADEQALLDSAGLSDREQIQYDKLRAVFNAGALEEARLEDLAEQNRQLLRQRAALDSLTAPEEDRRRMAQLDRFFARGIPAEEEIFHRRDTLTRCDGLRRENAELTAAGKKENLLPLILGIVLLVAGVILRLMNNSAAGLWGGGAALLTIGILQNRKLDRQRREIQKQTADNEAMRLESERSVREFVRQYSAEENLNAALDEIQRNRDEALTLREKLRSLQEKYTAQEALVRQTEAALRSQLGSDDFDRAISNLQLAREQVIRWMRQEAEREKKHTACQEKLNEILAPYGMKAGSDLRRQLQQIYDDRRVWESAILRQEQLAAQLGQFPEIPEHAADPESLKQEEQRLSEEYAALTETLLKLRQYCGDLQTQVERIPELTGELERWQEQKMDHQRRAVILDDTMDFLSKARERLTTSYLGPIRKNFDRYMTLLTSGQKETVFISPDLQVQMERQGQARELGYFSAGQTDLVMLCMRLALVDSLFRDVKPFVILDDPFVNMDDERTAEALKLLQKLGEDRQLIYLTCSSSRSL